MKKSICLLLAICMLVIAAAGCASNAEQSTDKNTDNNISDITEAASTDAHSFAGPTLYAVVSNPNPAVGEEIIVDIRLCNADLFSAIDFNLQYDEDSFSVRQTGYCDIPEMVNNMNVANGKCAYAGFVMKTANVEDANLFSLAISPKNNASGTHTFTFNKLSFVLSADAQGSETLDKINELHTEPFVLTVQ